MMPYIEEIYDGYNYKINELMELLFKHHIASPDEICSLCKIFKICYKNNLHINASY